MVQRSVDQHYSKEKQKTYQHQKQILRLDDYPNWNLAERAHHPYNEQYLMDLISALPDGYRVVFNLHAIDGYSHKQIAEFLGIKESSSRSRLARARKILQAKLNVTFTNQAYGNKRNPIDQTFHSLANHSSSEIPDELNWENMGPDIIAAINSKKRKRRITLFWFWGMAGIIALSVALVTFPVSTSDEDETTDLLENKSDLISLPKVMEQAKVDITSPSTTSPTRDLSHLHGQSTKADQYQVQQEGGEPQNGDVVQRNSLEMTNNINLKSVKNPKNNTRETNTGITRAIQTLPKDEQTEPSSTHYFTLNHSVVSRIDQSSITLIPLETTIEQIRFASPRFQIEHNSMVDPTKSSWWLDIYGGLNGFSSAYQSTNQQGVVPNRESNLAGWTAGLRVTRAKHRLMHFGFGIELNQLNYRFTNELFESTNLYRPNTIDTIIIQPFGLDSTIITRDSVPGTRHIRAQNYNSHKFLKVPLFVGLHHNWKNFDVALQVGVNLQVFRSTTGKTATRFPASIDLAADEFYQNAVGVSVFGEVQCVWKIQSQFHLVFWDGGRKEHKQLVEQ